MAGKSTPFDESDSNSNGDFDMKQLVKLEVQKYLKKSNLKGGSRAIYASFAGNVSKIALTRNNSDTWVIDSGATSHMCATLSNFTQYKTKKLGRNVVLPDGTIQQIKHIGIVCFRDRFKLDDVLHILTFKFNLL